MANTQKPIGGTFEDIPQADSSEKTVTQSVKDEVGQALEAGVQQITGQGQYIIDPQAQARLQAVQRQKVQQDQIKKQNVLRFLDQYKQQEALLKQKRYSEQQEKTQEKHVEEQKKQQQYVMKENKKEQRIKETVQRSQAERKAGKGLGG